MTQQRKDIGVDGGHDWHSNIGLVVLSEGSDVECPELVSVFEKNDEKWESGRGMHDHDALDSLCLPDVKIWVDNIRYRIITVDSVSHLRLNFEINNIKENLAHHV